MSRLRPELPPISRLTALPLLAALLAQPVAAQVLEASRVLFGSKVHRELSAPKVVTDWRRWVKNEPTTCDQVPSLLDVLALANELEITDLY